jgi:hypothetical protein
MASRTDDPFDSFVHDENFASTLSTPSLADSKAKAAGVIHNFLLVDSINFIASDRFLQLTAL